jgi:phage terminase large subunit GpA-like protein
MVYTGATDVQGNRLEWAVWGWSEGLTRWLVDWGVIEGDPADPAIWAQHDRIVAERRYAAGGGREQEVEAWAVDSGYMSQAVYTYTRSRPRLFAIDGRHGRTQPFIGSPVKVDVTWNGKRVPKGAVVWPVGTFPLKSDLYAAIRKTINGPDDAGAWRPGSMILPADADLAYCEQLTAEHLRPVEKRSGLVTYEWQKLTGRPNEALDIACYARAMAYHLGLDRLTAEQWAQLRAERGAPAGASPQGDLFEVTVAPAVTAAPPEPVQPARQRGVRGRIY